MSFPTFLNAPLAVPFIDALAGEELFVSFMTVAEIEHGMLVAGWGDIAKQRMRLYLHVYQTVESTPRIARLWAEVMAEGRLRGRRMASEDAWVAATALHLDCRLATNNQKHFSHIARLRLLDL